MMDRPRLRMVEGGVFVIRRQNGGPSDSDTEQEQGREFR